MTTTLRATPSLLDGYCGPAITDCTGLPGGLADEPAVYADGYYFIPKFGARVNVVGRPRLDLAPIDGRNSPAYWHVGEMVCRAVGRAHATPLDPRGGFTLLLCSGPATRPVWELATSGAIAYFTEKPEGTTDTEVHNLPDDPNAYPAALRAIACEVLGLEE